MPVVRLDSEHDPRIADYGALREPELVRARGLFVAEGRLVVERLIADGRCIVRSLLLNEAAYRALEPVLASLSPDVPIFIGRPDDFRMITGLDIHRGCLALAERPAANALPDLLREARTLVVLEGVTNADNVGGVFRNAAAFGADAVLLSPTCCDPLYRKAIRTSGAATLRVHFARLDPWPHALAALRTAGFAVVALTPNDPALSVDAFAAARPSRVALLVGTEGLGLSEAALGMADYRVRIPISPAVDSLNLAVATGIVLARLSDEGAL